MITYNWLAPLAPTITSLAEENAIGMMQKQRSSIPTMSCQRDVGMHSSDVQQDRHAFQLAQIKLGTLSARHFAQHIQRETR